MVFAQAQTAGRAKVNQVVIEGSRVQVRCEGVEDTHSFLRVPDTRTYPVHTHTQPFHTHPFHTHRKGISVLGSITNALDFNDIRSQSDAELLYDAKYGKRGEDGRMTRCVYGVVVCVFLYCETQSILMCNIMNRHTHTQTNKTRWTGNSTVPCDARLEGPARTFSRCV